LLVSKLLMHMLKFCVLLCSLVLILVFFYVFYFKKNFCIIKYVLLAFFILSCKSIWWLLPWMGRL
jgi:hypothetical protein